MTNPSPVAVTALELRTAFDRAYATPPSLDSEAAENLLAIRLAGEGYAIRVNEIAGIACDRKVVAVPTPIPELLGIVGIRGGVIPVYSLAALLGCSRDANQDRWLALCGKEEPMALAFAGFEGYLKVPVAQIYPASRNHANREYVKDAVRIADLVRAVIHIPSIVETIKQRCGHGRVGKER